jgi:tetratricopeptide (TPR) repeat protein
MKKYLYLLSALLVSAAIPAFAQVATVSPMTGAPMAEAPVVDPVMEQIGVLQSRWAEIKYQIPSDDAKLEAIHKLEVDAEEVSAAYPARPEPKIWEAIILSTDAGIVKGLSALSKVEKAKALLEEAEKIDTGALDGSAHTSLGSLYYQVPGWPVAFGDDEKAEQHLKMALQMNPNGIDPNYFYGDFLLHDDRPAEAKTYLERAISAPARPGRELADAGRHQEIKVALAKVTEKLKGQDKKDLN